MEDIIKKWLEYHRVAWEYDVYKIPEERVELLVIMLNSYEQQNK